MIATARVAAISTRNLASKSNITGVHHQELPSHNLQFFCTGADFYLYQIANAVPISKVIHAVDGGGAWTHSPMEGSGPPPNTWFIGPTQVHTPNGISIRFTAGHSYVQQTDTHRSRNIGNNRPHLWSFELSACDAASNSCVRSLGQGSRNKYSRFTKIVTVIIMLTQHVDPPEPHPSEHNDDLPEHPPRIQCLHAASQKKTSHQNIFV